MRVCEAIVVPECRQAEKLNRTLRASRFASSMETVFVGQMVHGRIYEIIYISESTMRSIHSDERHKAWFYEMMIARLSHRGQIIEIP